MVEDDPPSSRAGSADSEALGYCVLLAASATEAIDILTKHAAPIHVVVTDVIMPGESGRTVGHWVTRHKPGTKVIYMSGYTDDAISSSRRARSRHAFPAEALFARGARPQDSRDVDVLDRSALT